MMFWRRVYIFVRLVLYPRRGYLTRLWEVAGAATKWAAKNR